MNFENSTSVETITVPKLCLSSLSRTYAEGGQSHLVLLVMLSLGFSNRRSHHS